MKVVEDFQLVEIEKEQDTSKVDVIEWIGEDLEQLKLYKEGKLNVKSAKDLLNEL